MMRGLCALALVLAVAPLLAGPAWAEVTLFKGEPIAASGITIGGWGSGTAVEASERYVEGSRSIKISTQGLHEGGRIEFKTPIEIVEPTTGEADYLQFVLGFATVVLTGTASFVGPGFGITSAPGVTNLPTVSSYYYYEEEAPTRPKVNSARFVIESSDGRTLDATADVPPEPEDGWYKISIPFKVLGLKKDDSFKVARIVVFTDVPDVVYVGQIGTVTDTSPIEVQPGEEKVEASNDAVTFQADASGGAAMLRYSWNFGERGDDGEDASGQLVTHVFRAPGDYEVKLIVSDVWGIKKPVATVYKVSVN